MVVQIICGVGIEGALLGIVYVKMIKPKRNYDLKFSKNAVVCQRDSKLCFVFRVCDPVGIHAINTKIEAHWCKERL